MPKHTLTEVEVESPIAVRLSIGAMMLGAAALLAGLVAGFGLPSTPTAVPEPIVPGSLASLVEYDSNTATPYVPNHLLVKMRPGNDIEKVITDVLAKPAPYIPSEKVGSSSIDPTAATTTETVVETAPTPLTVIRKITVFTPKTETQPTDGTSKPDSSALGTVYDLEFAGDGFDPLAYAAVFGAKPGVEYAEPNYIVRVTQVVPNDPYFTSSGTWGQSDKDLWGLEKIGFTPEGQNSAWDIQKGDPKQIIADIDTGVDYTHEDLKDRIWINSGEDVNHNGNVDGELFKDVGADGISDVSEIGWNSATNADPAHDNYDTVTNPKGTEGNGKYDEGELFDDCGLDGICADDPRYTTADADDTQGNRKYDAGDFDGIDTDKNGYIDDIRGWDFGGSSAISSDNDPVDTFGHGTHIAGTIGASTNNGKGVAGINQNAKIMIVKPFRDHSSGATVSNLGLAIRYAADNGARVANASWGTPGGSKFLRESVQYAYAKNMIIVAAAGNAGADMSLYSPARYPEVITVSAFDPNDRPTFFTNYGAKIDVAAPGGGSGREYETVYNILSTLARNSDFAAKLAPYVVGGKYVRIAGTSMATPHVVGVVSLLTAQHPDWSIEQIRQALHVSADDVYTPGWDPYAGYGRVNARKSLEVELTAAVKILDPLQGASFSDRDLPFVVRGNIQGNTITRYTLYLGQGLSPSSWTTLKTASTQGENISLYDSLNPHDLVFGKYTLRLVVETVSGKVFEDRMTFSKILPYHGNWPVDTGDAFLVGTTLVADIDEGADKKLEILFQGLGALDKGTTYIYQEDGTPLSGWPKATDGNPVYDAAVGDILPLSPGKEIALVTLKPNTLVKLFRATGEEVTQNWPKQVNEMGLKLFDANGDGAQDILAKPTSSGLKFFKGDGDLAVPVTVGNPVSIGNFNTDSKPELLSTGGTIYSFDGVRTSLPNPFIETGVAADIDHDGMLEALVVIANQLHAFNGDGSEVEGRWPVQLKDFIRVDYHAVRTPAVGDITGDGEPEIVVATPLAVYAFDATGDTVPGWPVSIASAEATPVLGDVDGDGQNDVVFGTMGGDIHALHGTGREIEGWPMALNVMILNSLVLADLDKNGKNELVVASSFLDGVGRVYVYDTPGTTVAWPMRAFDERNTGAATVTLPKDTAEIVGAFNATIPFSEAPAKLLTDYKIPVTIGNIGGKAASNIQMQLYDGKRDSGGKQIGNTLVIPALDPGKQETREFIVNFKQLEDQGVHSVYFYTDSANTVPEMYEGNVTKRLVYLHDTQLSKTEELFSTAYYTVRVSGKYIVAGEERTLSKIELRDTELKTNIVLTTLGKNPKIQGNMVLWSDGAALILYHIDTAETEIITRSATNSFNLSENYITWVEPSPLHLSPLYVYTIATKEKMKIVSTAVDTSTPVLWKSRLFYEMDSPPAARLQSYNIETKASNDVRMPFKYVANSRLEVVGDTLLWVSSNEPSIRSFSNWVFMSLHLPFNTTVAYPINFFRYSPVGTVYIPRDASSMYYDAKASNYYSDISDFYSFPTYTKILKSAMRDSTVDQYYHFLSDYGNNGAILTSSGKTILAEYKRPNHPPIMKPISDKSASLGSNLSFQVQASDLENDTVTYTSPNLPTGATLNVQTGAFTWVPKNIIVDDVKGDLPYLITFKATDSKGASSQISVKITISATATPTCFAAGTLITRADGTTTEIERLRVGDAVLAYDEATGKLQPARITKTFEHTAEDYVRINGNLVVTPNHPVLSNGQWVEVGTLKVGDSLTSASGEKQLITSVERKVGSIPVYNLEVEPFHTYIAGGFVVHNKLAPPAAPKPVNEGVL